MSDDPQVDLGEVARVVRETRVLHTYPDGAVLLANGKVALNVQLPDEPPPGGPPDEVTVEYGVFNDEDTWGPLFEDGTLHESLREVLLDRPLYSSESLREAAQHARLTNEERATTGQVDKFGHVVVKTSTVTRSPWRRVPLDDVARELGEF